MKKSDLKTGMIVTLRNGNKFMVFLNANRGGIKESDVIVNFNGATWSDLNGFNEDLTCKFGVELDIVIVEEVKATVDLIYKIIHPSSDRTNIIWERKEKKRYTYEQIKKVLGEEFEVVANAEDVSEMTLDDLKTGMIITLREGMQYMVYKCASDMCSIYNAAVAIDGTDNWVNLDLYNQDLTEKVSSEFDVIKVEAVTHPFAFIRTDYQADKRKVLWERKKKYTYDQLKEKLGEEFEIVKEN